MTQQSGPRSRYGREVEAQRAPRASNAAWTSLLHAEVAYLLGNAGIPVLHIKGPTVAQWLYDAGERDWGDVDILVAPSRVHDALRVLHEHGFVERYAGVGREATTDHAVCVYRTDPDVGVDEVDVHDRFPGIDGQAEEAFGELWRRREPAQLAHTDVWFPDLPSRALLVVLNSARTASAKATEDLARVTRADVDWELVVQLADRISALPALRAGLELDDAGRAIVSATRLADVAVSSEWRLRIEGASRTALRIDELRRMSWPRRVRAVARWLFPAPAVLRMRDPRIGSGPIRVGLGYVRRIGDGLRALPESARALRRNG